MVTIGRKIWFLSCVYEGSVQKLKIAWRNWPSVGQEGASMVILCEVRGYSPRRPITTSSSGRKAAFVTLLYEKVYNSGAVAGIMVEESLM